MPVRELSSAPSMLPLFARASASLIPGASRLPFVGGGGGASSEVPDLALVLNDVVIDGERLAAYDRVCGFTLRDELPPTYPHMLAFPLHLALMTDGSFPFPAIGLVHIYNRIVQHRPVRVGERLSLKVWAGPVQAHPRGRQFSIHSEARVGEELAWEEVSTNLRRGSGAGSASESGPPSAPEVPSGKGLPASATWKLPGELGRRYGSVSGDLNPIHIHPLSARLFGFHSAIAHGMWTKARCLAALQSRLPASFTVEAAFRKPILLPATVEFAEAEAEGGRGGAAGGEAGRGGAGGGEAGRAIAFGVRDARKGTPHLDGRVTLG